MISLSHLKVKSHQLLDQVWSVASPEAERVQLERGDLTSLAAAEAQLPDFVQACPVALKYLRLLGDLDWSEFPERPPGPWPGPKPHPRAPFVAAYLLKLNEGHLYMTHLRTYLLNHPALVWILGFRLAADEPELAYPFEVEQLVPSSKQLGRVLRDLPDEMLQFLLKGTVKLLQAELPDQLNFGDIISLDTKHIQAWVAENNPKAYIKESDRLNKDRQPKGDRDCKLGCKKKANRPAKADSDGDDSSALKTSHPEPQKTDQRGQKAHRPTNFSPLDVYYWGYASGVVATKLADWGEFVLAELTQTFNADDNTYFHPLMAQTETNLGFQPTYGTFDKAFDSWYCYDYFAQNGGFAAIPFSGRGGELRRYNDDDLPLCQADLPMPLKYEHTAYRGLVPQPKGCFACPLLFPEPTGQSCPIDHHRWPKGGCLSTFGTSKGAVMRHQLDRDSQAYKDVFKQRTATERINAQAKELGIERPKLRNFQAIAHQNTLIYVLINLKALKRIRLKKEALAHNDIA